jgi:hypothetical protein
MEQQLNLTFDRKIKFDKNSLDYNIERTLDGLEPFTKLWPCGLILKQEGGSCAAFAVGLELAALPVPCKGITVENVIRKSYWPAQMGDDFPGGEYPNASPRKGGTALIDVLKLARKYGACDTFEWSFTMRGIQVGIAHNGPAIVGTECYEGMLKPDRDGYIHPTGRSVGGHAYLLLGVNMELGYFDVLMAWGPGWGQWGRAKITFADFDLLRRRSGECAFLVGRHEIDLNDVVVEAIVAEKLNWWQKMTRFFRVVRAWE